MEEQLEGSTLSDNWREEFVRSLDEHRQRAESLLREHRERIKSVEAALDQQTHTLVDELERDRQQTQRQSDKLEHRESEIQQQAEHFARMQDDFQRRKEEWEHHQSDFSQQQKALQTDFQLQSEELERRRIEVENVHLKHKEREQLIERREAELATLGEQLDANRQDNESQHAELNQSRVMLDEAASQQQQIDLDLKKHQEIFNSQRADFQRQCDQLDQRVNQTNGQRRRIAGELRAQRSENLAEIERSRAELQQAQSGEHAELQKQLLESHNQRDTLQIQIDQSVVQVEDAQQQIEELKSQIQEVVERAAASADSNAATSDELASLRDERDRLIELLELAKTEIERLESSGGGHSEQMASLRKRYEMSLEDVRQLTAEKDQLEDKLAKNPQTTTAVAATGGGLDWEAQKKILLAQLESDVDEQDEDQVQSKLSIEGAIKITDQVVAEKEDEIIELKRLLDEQSTNIGAIAVGASAIAESLDQDELIREEREYLKQLQDEWREKLRAAEIDISIERARLGRERKEMEDKLRQLESNAAHAKSLKSQGDDSKKDRKPDRGRWLTKLGLKNDKDK